MALTLSESDRKTLLQLAGRSIDAGLMGQSAAIPPTEMSEVLTEICGAFVTLNRQGQLRGCIGHIVGTLPLWETVWRMAQAAAFEDPRFPSLRDSERDLIDIEISVLTPLEPVDSYLDIEIGRHGVLLEKGHHTSVFLPQVATEQGWDRETMLTELAMKAGLAPFAWREDARFSVFEAIVFGEK